MMKNRGMISVPLVLGLITAVTIIAVTLWLTGGEKPVAPASEITDTSVVAPTPKKSRLIWQAGLSGALLQVLQPKANYSELFAIDGPTTIKVVTTGPDVTLALKPLPGVNSTDFTVTKTVVPDPETGAVATIFQIISNNPNSDIGTGENSFEVIITNEDRDEPADFSIDVSDDENENIEGTPGPIDNDGSNTEDEATVGGEASLSITIIETLDLNVTSPIIGAQVVAVITSPSGQVFVVELTETSPGIYTGVFNNITEVGTYQVVYVISGTTSDGESFDQTVEDSFEVTEGDLDDEVPNYESTKIFDINQSNEIRPKQVGDY